MFSPDLSKMFDPQTMTQTWTKSWQQWFDVNSAVTNNKSTTESYKQINNVWADTYSACCQKQLQLCQTTMESSVEAMRDLSTAKGLEDYMGKQAEWSRKISEKCQAGAQEIANTVQYGQAQCNDIISKMMSQSYETSNGNYTTSPFAGNQNNTQNNTQTNPSFRNTPVSQPGNGSRTGK